MAELAPGLAVSDFVRAGNAVVCDLAAAGMPGPPLQIAFHPSDWERIPPAEREALIDAFVRADAARGVAIIDDFRRKGWL